MNHDQRYTGQGIKDQRVLSPLALLPIPLLLVAIAVLWAADLQVAWPSPFLYWLVHYGSATIGIVFIAIPAARNFAVNGQPSVLMLGCGVLMLEIGAAAMPAGTARSTGTGFAIYNTSVLLSALCHFAGVAISSRCKTRLTHAATWLPVAYAGAIATMLLVIWLALTGWMPVFFIDGRGGTLLRTLVVSAAVALFLLTSGLLWQTNRRRASSFLHWYALGLVLLAAGLCGSMLIVVKDSPLQWVTRFTQLFGMIYMCVAILTSARASSGSPLAAVEEAWREKEFLAGLRQQTPLGLILRFGLAIVAVAAGMGVRLAFMLWAGAELSPYISFYPAIMVVALLAGFGPGLAATVLADFVVGYWVNPPIGQFSFASPTERLSMVIFTCMGLFMSLVAELYRRNRDKAAAYDSEAALRETKERLNVTLASIGDAVVTVDTAGRVDFLNPIAVTLTGWKPEDAFGQPIQSVFKIINEKTNHPAEDIVQRVLLEGHVVTLANHNALVTKSGRQIPIEDSAAPIKDQDGNVLGVVLVFHDVTEKRRAHGALLESEARYRNLFDSMAEAFALHEIITDEQGRPCDYCFLDVNNSFECMTGLKRSDIVNRNVREILPGIETFWIETYGKVALTGEPVSFEKYYPAPLDRWYQVFAYRPGPRQFATVFLDISQRKGTEEELYALNKTLEGRIAERTEELQRVNRTLRMTSECNQILVRATNEQELMQDICRIIIEIGGYRMVWVGYAEDDTEKTVRPVASLGFEEGYLKNARISWADTERGRGPTGRCIRTGDICVGRDFLEDPDLTPWRKEALKRGFRSSIALPMKSDGRVFGAITIYAQEPYAFDRGHELLRELADDLAFGISVIRSHVERDMAKQIAEKRAGQLQALAAELMQAEQKERRQLAKILHDHLQQLLVGAKFGASFIRAKATSKDIVETADQLIETLDESIRSSRSLTADLSPPILHEKGLAAGLEWLGRQVLEKYGLRLELHADTTAEPASDQVRIFLFESVRELLLNIVKHAKVHSAQISMSRLESEEIELIVADEGVGFDPAQVELHPTTGGFGLFSIRERLNYLGGRIQISAVPGQGSRFTLVAPAQLTSQSNQR